MTCPLSLFERKSQKEWLVLYYHFSACGTLIESLFTVLMPFFMTKSVYIVNSVCSLPVNIECTRFAIKPLHSFHSYCIFFLPVWTQLLNRHVFSLTKIGEFIGAFWFLYSLIQPVVLPSSFPPVFKAAAKQTKEYSLPCAVASTEHHHSCEHAHVFTENKLRTLPKNIFAFL